MMYTGKKLGEAIQSAIKLKGTKLSDLARHFGIKQPSVSGWIKNGSIGKEKLEPLFLYFSDVVGPEHWGLGEEYALYHAKVDVTNADKDSCHPVLTEEEENLLRSFRMITDPIDRIEVSRRILRIAEDEELRRMRQERERQAIEVERRKNPDRRTIEADMPVKKSRQSG